MPRPRLDERLAGATRRRLTCVVAGAGYGKTTLLAQWAGTASAWHSLTPGDRLPSEVELGQAFGVSRSTVREALRSLSSQHLVYTSRGVTGGSFVSAADQPLGDDDTLVVCRKAPAA